MCVFSVRAQEQQVPDVDPELLEIFLEEAGELSEKLEQGFATWAQDTSSKGAIDGLMRSLHTLKGNARFAQISDLGDLSHAMESLFASCNSCSFAARSPAQCMWAFQVWLSKMNPASVASASERSSRK